MTDPEFAEAQHQILKGVPEEFRAVLSHYAYMEFHGHGPGEILWHLQDLVDMLSEPIRKYRDRMFSISSGEKE